MSVHSHYLPRHVDDLLARSLNSAPVLVVDGPRAVGKTTSARRLARSELSLPRDLERLEFDPVAVLNSLERPVLIDEWQLAGTDLLWSIKSIVDSAPDTGQFILVGSVEPASYGPTYPLTGRATRVVMRPMTALETAGRGDLPLPLERLLFSELAPDTGRVAPLSWSDIARSGFPLALTQQDPSLYLEAYASSVAHRAGDEGKDASRLLRTMKVLATLASQAVPQQRIWEAADITKVTWKGYEDLLMRTHVSSPLPSFDTNRLARITTYPKQLLADTALAMTLAGVTQEDAVRDPGVGGRYLESHVVQQIRPQADAMSARLSHVRTSNGAREIDIVIEHRGSIYGLEVKATSRPHRRDARHLVWLRDTFGDAFKRGFVLHTGDTSDPLDEQIWTAPISALVA